MAQHKVLPRMKTLEPDHPNKSIKIIGGKSSGILNWNDTHRSRMFGYFKKLHANSWFPTEINMQKDALQFPQLPEEEKTAYKLISALLTSLDSFQVNYIHELSPYISDKAVKDVLMVVGNQETVHNWSYSYQLSSVVGQEQALEVFEMARTHPEITKRNNLVVEVYEAFRKDPTPENFAKTLVAANALEGIFFYSGFAYFYHLARNQKMVSTSTMIRYIQGDEMVHNRIVCDVFREVLYEYPEIDEDGSFTAWAEEFIGKAVQMEIDWMKYVLKDIKFLDIQELEDYLKYLGNKRMRLMGGRNIYEGFEDNPCRWIQAYADETIDDDKTDFFEQKSRQYQKPVGDNGFDEL